MSLRHLIICCALFCAACSSTTSDNVTTQGIYADIDVVAEGNGRTVVTAQLEVGSGGLGRTVLELAPGDTLTARANGIQLPMTEDSSILNDFRYRATFNFDSAGTTFTVAFNRASGISAPNSNVALPDGFVISSPTANDTFSTVDEIPIVWAPSGTSIIPEIRVRITCTQTNGLPLTGTAAISLNSDSGATTFPVTNAMPLGMFDTSRLCNGEIEFERFRRGNLDRNYGEGGQITAQHFGLAPFFVDLTL